MKEIRTGSRWRTFVSRMAALSLVWLLLATTFAVQFYWMGKDLPVRISWKDSFLRALVEWSPWMILSPAVVWLAERFRFDRARWFWGVLPHVLACLGIALACQGISMLLPPRERGFVFHTGSFGFARGGAGVVSGLALNTNSSPDAPPLPRVILKSTNRSIDQAAGGPGLRVGEQPLSIHMIDVPSGTPAPGALQITSANSPISGDLPPPLTLAIPGPWTRFFQLAFARAQSTIPIYWAIACVTWLIGNYQQLRERERRTLELEARLMQANLQTLKTQLQPHFLFNTLNAIASLVRRKPDVAEDMIGSLSDFLRMSLDTAHQHEVPLRREIDFLDLYLEIQQARFGERLRIQKQIDPAALDVAVPTLILQPLVENSIRHGIEPRETGGTILIRSLRCETSLRLEVRDDGEGLKAGQLTALREGVGLSNTKARLQELHGGGHCFQITPNAEGGLTVAVELPWREMPSKQA